MRPKIIPYVGIFCQLIGKLTTNIFCNQILVHDLIKQLKQDNLAKNMILNRYSHCVALVKLRHSNATN